MLLAKRFNGLSFQCSHKVSLRLAARYGLINPALGCNFLQDSEDKHRNNMASTLQTHLSNTIHLAKSGKMGKRLVKGACLLQGSHNRYLLWAV